MKRMSGKALAYQLYARGRDALPAQLGLDGRNYRFRRLLKHDFFAATAVYDRSEVPDSGDTRLPCKIVLKLSRKNHFLGMPMLWLGKLICANELSVHRLLSHLRGVPTVLGEYGSTGFIYEYVEGCSLKDSQQLPDDFFDNLHELVQQIHNCQIVYFDMNKRSNILVGSDNLPYLIDFQISLRISDRALITRRLSAYLRRTLQAADFYHLFKHKRKIRPSLLRPHEHQISCETGLIQAHRLVATPLRKLRRCFLRFLQSHALTDVDQPPDVDSTR